MPVATRSELQDRIKELEAENEELQARLDEISDIVTPGDDEEADDDEDDDDESGE